MGGAPATLRPGALARAWGCRVEEVDVHEARRRQEQGWIYLDVRTPDEWRSGRPAGAAHEPAFLPGPGGMAPVPDFVARVQERFPAPSRLLIGCASGMRSARAATLLQAAGFAAICNVRGGFLGARDPMGQVVAPGWREAGHPVDAG